MAYLRSVRLHHAHLELVTGDQSTTSVAEIAGRWGFGHAGRRFIAGKLAQRQAVESIRQRNLGKHPEVGSRKP